MSQERWTKGIERAAGDKPVPELSQVVQSNPPAIPRKGERAYEYTENGLLIRRELSEKDWRVIPSEMKAVSGKSRPLNVGDAALYGLEQGYISTFEEASEMFGVMASSIEIYVSICRNVPQLIRVNPLTFKHYRYIAPLPDEEKVQWIEYAASNKLSSGDLQKLIALVNPPQLPETTNVEHLDMPPGVTIERIDLTSPALSDDMPPTVDPSPVTDKTHRQRMNRVWKKVESDTLTDDDLQDVFFIRDWCDRILKQRRQRK